MMRYLSRTGYETAEQLHARIAELEAQAAPLLAERKKLYRKPDAQARIDEINELLRPVWAEVYLCRDIEKHSEAIRKELGTVRAAVRGSRLDRTHEADEHSR